MDMLVRLYALPDAAAARARAACGGVTIRRPEPWERDTVVQWVVARFSPVWAGECELAFCARPPTMFVAVRDAALIGFACHDCARRNFFGPAGVDAAHQRRGIGAALTLSALEAMRAAGYAYAIVGGVGPAAFYARVAGATEIPDSTPGIYDFSVVRAAPPSPEP